MTEPKPATAASRVINVFVDPSFVEGDARTLEFLSKDLGEDIDLLLLFEAPRKPGELYVDLFPIYWKIITLFSSGVCCATVDYSGRTGWVAPQANHSDLVDGHYFQRCESGQRCSLRVNPNYDNYLTQAVPGKKGFIQCLNDTGGMADIALGLCGKDGSNMEPIFCWKDIDHGSIVTTTFNPVLKIYAQRRYREKQLIKANIESQMVWEGNLVELREFTTWNVVISPENRRVAFEKV